MLYQAYQAQSNLTSPLRLLAQFASASALPLTGKNSVLRQLAAAGDVLSRMRLTHSRPAFGIHSVVMSSGVEVPVVEEQALKTPFATLLRFRKEVPVRTPVQPPVLLVAPLSGHFATLLRETARTLLQDHDVYITDWNNARDVPLSQGAFGLDEYVDHMIRFLAHIGPGAHMVAVCQPCVAALAAAALMAEDSHPAQPRSLTLMAGPVDCRVNPTEVNRLAVSRPIEWFEKNLVSHVPLPHAGFMRRVYPGFLQLTAFMSMNPDRHRQSFEDMYRSLVDDDHDKAQTIQTFYEEYLAVNDLAAEFYLETVSKVFQTFDLPRGVLTWRGRTVNPAAIRKTALLTVEGERDDICAVGQTVAAQDMCTGIRPYMRAHHVQTGVGHYGVFSGRRWSQQIYPRVREVIHQHAA
ncbi:polyhydroxyalkanoate depolymerase [Ramlibacter sp. H39-3-26]|uniref:polyhydroxyalkanoate depolymerase n=1 Tax=Curvibacter soli TaxID=3031331 RepID=UPI0023DA7668|nr:polyhydroxyalkanoate depolymerase [Ramlibacter sp. H39-3-26]MDF1486212.1 polyhydroxyalkanoate depolymerase [Ramlibacter sp. H39-3-26]